MANTNTPATSTHQQQFVSVMSSDFVTHAQQAGGTTTTNKRLSSAFVNCYPVVDKVAYNDPKYRVTNIPPLNFYYAGTADYLKPKAAILCTATGYIYSINENGGLTVYDPNSTIVTEVATAIGASTGYSLVEYGGPLNRYLMILNHSTSSLFAYNIALAVPALVGSVVLPTGVSGLVFLDGYLFTADGYKIYNSTLADVLVWNTTVDFIAAEMFADGILHIDKHHNHLVAFGYDSIEFFYDAAVEVGSPLKRQAAYAQKIGLVTGGSVTNLQDTLYFTASTHSSVAGLFAITDFKIRKIDKPALDSVEVDKWQNSYLNPINFDGRYGISIGFSSYSSTTKTFCYMIDTDEMIELDLKNYAGNKATIYIGIIYTHRGKNATWVSLGTSWGFNNYPAIIASNLTSSLFGEAYVQPAIWRTYTLDFGNYNNKHIKWVDVLGSLGDTTINLKYYKDQNTRAVAIDVGNKTQNTLYPVRWRNLGPHRRILLELTFTPRDRHDNYSFEGLSIAYNQHAY